MIKMDIKGGSWVGNIYQKFETMCVEVEEVIYEDTFKYVDNHVRNVGETVKKFYSDVVQDLLPPPLDPVKEEDTLSCVGLGHGDNKISKKLKVDDEIGSENLAKDFDVASAHEDSISYAYSCSPIFSVIKPCKPMSIYSAGEKGAEDNSWSEGAELVLSNQSPSEANHPNSFKDPEECLSDFPSIDETKTNTLCEVTFDEPCTRSNESTSIHEDTSSKQVPTMNHDETDGRGTCRVMIECCGGDDAVKVKKMRILSNGPFTIDLNGHLSTDLGLSSMEADLIRSKSSMENTIELDMEHSPFETETPSPSLSTEYSKCEADERYIVERLSEVRLGESCVLVERSDTLSKPGRQRVQKSYKKKIQDVLSPRRWSKSKRDNEELADWYDEQYGKSLVYTTNMMLAERKSQMSESLESDWELL